MANPFSVLTTAQRRMMEEFDSFDALIADLLAGCFGSLAYMEHEYGITANRCQRLVTAVEETPAYLREEYGLEVTTREVWDTLRAYHAIFEEFEDKAREAIYSAHC